MNFIRYTLFLSLTVFVFVGSVGVGVYSHFCEKDGIEQSYFIRQAHHCEKEEVQNQLVANMKTSQPQKATAVRMKFNSCKSI